MKKRMLALVLTLAMLLSMVPGTVFAAETETEHTEHNFVEVRPETEAPVTEPDSSTEPPVTEPDSSTEPTEAEKAPVKSPQTTDSVQDLLAAIDYKAAVADLEYLTRTIGTRPAGSIGEHMAAEYVRNVFDELGYDSSVQEVPIVKNSYWPGTIGEIYLGDLTLSGFGPISNANYTGFGHAEGTAVYLSDPANVASLGSDLRGKVVFFPGNWRSGKSYNANTISCIQALDAANAEGIVVLMDHTIDPAEASNIWFPTLTISASNPISTPILLCNNYEYDRVPAYLAEHPDTAVSLDSRNSDIHSHNTIGIKKAAVETDWTIYVTGHMDSVMPGPGANDNASGTLGVLALARAFKDVETNYNICFITLGAEEIGLVGSKYFAQNMTAEQKDHAIGCYNMDMIATSLPGCDIIYMMVPTNDFSLTNNIVENRVVLSTYRAAEELGYDMNKVTAVKEWASDHSSFNDVGIPAVGYILSTSRTSLTTETVYHTINDNYLGVDSTTDNFDFDRLENSVDLVATAVYNDATANYVAVMGTGINREYYTTVAEAMSASTVNGAQVALMSTGEILNYSHSHKNSDGTTTTVSKALLADMVPGGQTVTLESGQYFLPEDVTTNVTFEIKGDVEICLNGHTISFDISSGDTGAQSGGFYVNGGSLTIDDTCSTGAGRITASVSSTGENLAPIRVSGNGSLTLDTVRVDSTARVRSTKKADTGSNGQEESAIIVDAGSTATINQSNLSGSEYGIWNQGSVTVNGGNIDGGVYGIKNEGTLSVENCYIGYGRTAVQYAAGEAVFIPFLEGTTAADISLWGTINGCNATIDTNRGVMYGNITKTDPYIPMYYNKGVDLNYVIKSGDILEMRQLTSGLNLEGLTSVESFWVTNGNTNYHADYGREGTMTHNTGTYQTVVYDTKNKGNSDRVGYTLKKIRVDPVATQDTRLTAGYYEYDYIYFGPANRSPAAIMASVDKADYGVYNAQGSTFNLGAHVEVYGSTSDLYLGNSVVVNTTGAIATPEDGKISVQSGANLSNGMVKITNGWSAVKDTTGNQPFMAVGTTSFIQEKDGELWLDDSSNYHFHDGIEYTPVTYYNGTNFDKAIAGGGYFYTTRVMNFSGSYYTAHTSSTQHTILCLANGGVNGNFLTFSADNDFTLFSCGSGGFTPTKLHITKGTTTLKSVTATISTGSYQTPNGNILLNDGTKLVVDGAIITAKAGSTPAIHFNTGTAFEVELISGKIHATGNSVVSIPATATFKMNGNIELATNNNRPHIQVNGGLIELGRNFYPYKDGQPLTYTVSLGPNVDPADGPVRLTRGWNAVMNANGIDHIPFTYVNSDYTVVRFSGELYIVPTADVDNYGIHEHCVYGENCEFLKAGQECTHSKVEYTTALDSDSFASSINASGFYYLIEDVALNSKLTLNCGGEITLCLGGHSITGNMQLDISGGTKLYLCNCKRESETDGTYHVSNATVSGEFWLYGGDFIMNSTASSTISSGKFVIDGGNFIADPGTGAEEANVYVNLAMSNAEIILRSGSVVNYGTNGATVCHAGVGYVILDGDISLTGGSSIADIWLFPAASHTAKLVTIREGFDPKGQVYTIHQDVKTLGSREKYQITSGWGQYASHLDYIPFESTQGYLVVELEENGTKELYLIRPEDHAWFVPHYHYLDNGEVIYFDQKLTQEMWSSYGANLPAGNYVVVDNLSHGGKMYYTSGGQTVRICLCGRSISAGELNASGSGNKVYISDCTTDPQKVGTINHSQIYSDGRCDYYFENIKLNFSSNWLAAAVSGHLYMKDVQATSASNTYGFAAHSDGSEFTIIGGTFNVPGTYAFDVDGFVGITLGGTPVINGGKDPDFLLYDDTPFTFSDEYPFVPGDQTYTVMTVPAPEAGAPMRITEGWSALNLDTIPFVSTQGYAVRELTVNGVTELYLVIPELTVEVNDPAMGSASADVLSGVAGTPVTVTATPVSDKYYVSSVVLTYWNGAETVAEEISFTTDENGVATANLTMPAADATVTVNFKKYHVHTMSVDCSVSDNEEENIVFATELNQDNIGYYKSGHVLADGYYVLTSDITIDMIYLNSYAYICLNGYTITSTHSTAGFETQDSRSLYICDCSSDKTGGITTTNSNMLLWSFAGPMHVYGGNYNGTSSYGLYVRNAVHFYDGNVYGKDYGACLESGTLTIAGGTITSGGMGIEYYGGTLTLSGSPIINGTNEDIYIYHGDKVIYINGLLTPPDGETYSVRLGDGTTMPTVGHPIQITEGFHENGNTYNCFTSADPNYFTYVKNGEVYLGVKANITVKTEGEGTAVAKDANGNVISKALETDTVKIDATPAEGYTVAKVVLSYMEGETEVRKLVSIDDDGMYGFPMPGVEATVTVTFREPHIHTLADGSTIVYDTFVDQEVWDSIRNSVPEGNYVLVDDVSGHCSLKSNSYINICLCGYDVNAKGSETYLYTGTTLRIDDCTPDDELLGTISMPQVYAEGPGHIIIADGIYHGYGAIASIALKGGSFTMEGGYFISDASMGMALGSQVAGISDFSILGGSLKCTTGMVLEGDCGKIVLGGDLAITGKDYDIRFYPGHLISFDKDYPLNPPTGETYILHLASGSVTAEQPVLLTSGWADSGLASTATTEAKIPFAVYDNKYVIREKDYEYTVDGETMTRKELYLCVPEVECFVEPEGTGKLTASPATVSQGTVVILTPTPGSAYKLSHITLEAINGPAQITVDLVDKGDGTYSFTMPFAYVKATAHFEAKHQHYMSNTPNSEAALPDGSSPEYVKFDKVIDSVETLNSYLVDGVLPTGSYVLLDNITYDGVLTIGGDVDLCLNGYTFTLKSRAQYILVNDGATLNLCDCSEAHTGTITKTASESGGGMLIDLKGNLNIYGGKLDAVSGCGVSSSQTETATRVFSMYGGTLTGTGSPVVTLEDAEMYLYDGTISAGSVAVNATGGTKVIMNGGNITSTGSGIASSGANEIYIYGGNITSNGAGVTVGSLSKLDMSGGTIDSKSTGVLVDISNIWNGVEHTFYIGEFIMSGGSVTGASCGIDARGNVTLNGGTVTGATALKLTSDLRTYAGESLVEFGGKVILNDGVLNGNIYNESDIEVNGGIINGTVTNTTRNQTMSGLPHTHEGVFVMNGGTINGGDYAVYHVGGEFVINGAVELNSSVADIYLAIDKTVTIGESFVAPTEAYTVKPEVSPTDGNYVKFTTGWGANATTNAMGNYPFAYVGETEGVLIWKFRDSAEEPSELHFAVPHTHTRKDKDGNVTTIVFDRPLTLDIWNAGIDPSGTLLASGNYVFVEDIAVSQIRIRGTQQTANFCLCGHDFTSTGAFTVLSEAAISFADCAEDPAKVGEIKATYFHDEVACDMYMDNIKLTLTDTKGYKSYGVAILARKSLILRGCQISANTPLGINGIYYSGKSPASNYTFIDCSFDIPNGYAFDIADLMKFNLGGTLTHTGNKAYDIKLYPAQDASKISFLENEPFVPNGQTYGVELSSTLSAANPSVRITNDWTNSGLASKVDEDGTLIPAQIPFYSTQGYAVVEQFCTQTQQTELYLILPTVTCEVEGEGTLTADHDACLVGTTVTLTATPAEGHMLCKLEITYVLNGETVKQTLGAKNGVCTFTMPNANVTAKATFTPYHVHDDGMVFDHVLTQEVLDAMGGSVPAGNYVLVGEITAGNIYFTNGGETNLCLCGQTITQSGETKVENGTTLKVYDCLDKAQWTMSRLAVGYNNQTSGQVYLYGGTFTALKNEVNKSNGAPFKISDYNSNIYIDGATLIGASGFWAGVASVLPDSGYKKGSIHLISGTVINSGDSGAVEVDTLNGRLHMEGSFILDCREDGAEVNLYDSKGLGAAPLITITGPLNPPTDNNGVRETYTVYMDGLAPTYGHPIQFTEGWGNYDHGGYIPFTSYQGYVVREFEVTYTNSYGEEVTCRELFMCVPELQCIAIPEGFGTLTAPEYVQGTSGMQVTLIADPAENCKLESLTMVGENGSDVFEIVPTDNGDGTFTFKMPSAFVTATAVFKPYKTDEALELYLWKDHKVALSAETVLNAVLSCDPDHKIFAEDGTFALKGLMTEGLEGVTVAIGDTYDFVGTDAGTYTGQLHITFTGDDGEEDQITVPITAKVYEVQDSVFVLDYDKAVVLDEHLFTDDIIPGVGENGDTVLLKETFTMEEPNFAPNGLYMDCNGVGGVGQYGIFSFSEDGSNSYYTPNGMIDGADSAYLVIRAYKNGEEKSNVFTIDPFKEVEMYKKVTILPANVVYYEDDNPALKWKPSDDISIDIIGYSSGYQYGDNNSPYGNDSDYTNAPDNLGEYGGSGGVTTKITVNGSQKILSFTFKGTGFDVIGSTTANSGQLIYQVFKIEIDANGKQTEVNVKTAALNTVYNGSGEAGAAIYEVPLIHVMDLPHGTYKVVIRSVASYNWSDVTKPVPGQLPPVKETYLYFDGVRIYNPIAEGSKERENYLEGERTAKFVQVRNMILNGQAAVAKIEKDGSFNYSSALISYVEMAQNGMKYEGNAVSSLNDYLVAGPNNEVYFNQNTQTLVFYVKETAAEDGAPMLQLAIRNLNPEAFDKAENDGYAPKIDLLIDGGKSVNLVSDETAISYTEQYYTINYRDCVQEPLNGETYYRVVISARNSSAFAMTNLKVSGLEFHTNPNSVATLHYNEYGVLVDTTATETVAFAMPNLYLLARQLMAANHMLPEDELPGQAAELTFRSVSLSLQSSIGMNLYVAKETLQGYVDPFVRLTKTVYDETGKASTVTVDIYDYEEVQVQGQDCIRFFYGDIAAKEMGSNVHMELMATDSNLLRVMEGENRDYSVVQYAKNMLEKNLPAQFKTLLVDMVNYGAEAQAHFRYNTANPANAGFEAYQHLATVAQPNMVSCTNKDSVNELAPMPEGVGYLTKVAGASLVLEDKVKVNLFVDVKDGSGQDNLGRTVKVAYADVTGTTVVEDVVIAASHLDSNGKYYRVTFDGLHATDMRTAFMAWVVNAEGVRISNTMTYSIESYGASVMSGTASAYVAMQPLVVAMMKYGDSAKAYFSNSK